MLGKGTQARGVAGSNRGIIFFPVGGGGLEEVPRGIKPFREDIEAIITGKKSEISRSSASLPVSGVLRFQD